MDIVQHTDSPPWPPDAVPVSENGHGSVSWSLLENVTRVAKAVANQTRIRVLARTIADFSITLLSDLNEETLMTRLRADVSLAQSASDVRTALMDANSELVAAVQDGNVTSQQVTAVATAQEAALHFLEEVQS